LRVLSTSKISLALAPWGFVFVLACGGIGPAGDPCNDPAMADSAECACPSPATDYDCDGVAATSDCDDQDPELGAHAKDMDCDGVPTNEDCDDNDSDNLSSNIDDADCDGLDTTLDCDDEDDTNTSSSADDADCDGIDTTLDCDDEDDTNTSSSADDADCDGIPTAIDCDDNNPDKVASSEFDHDCDGVLSVNDCDDEDDTNTESCIACIGDYTFDGGDGPGQLDVLTNCSSIEGSLSLTHFPADQLQSLANLIHVTGDFRVMMLTGLTDLDSVSRLKEVGGDLEIRVMPDLGDIAALSGMKAIGGDVTFWSNTSLCQSEVDAFLTGGVSYSGEGLIGSNDEGC